MLRLKVLVSLAIVCFLAATYATLYPPKHEPVVTGAIGVMSPCGMYAAFVIRSDGSIDEFNSDREPTDADKEVITAVPSEQRHAVLVPGNCGLTL